ncbi:MAG: hypothetical protein ABI661_04680 [Gammaproteobacteria bacterium]
MRKLPVLASAVATTLATSTADAAVISSMQLTQFVSYSNGGSSAGNIGSSTAAFQYDDVAGLLTQTVGTFNVRFTISPSTTLFRHSITGLVIGNGGAAGASTYVCTEGNFGVNVGASLCGNYSFGNNFVNESTVTWGPGTVSSRIIGGDDMALGLEQSVAGYDDFTTISWNGSTLVLANTRCGGTPCAPSAGANSGFRMTLLAPVPVPVPVAAWLFGGALAALGLVKRRAIR